MEGLVVRFVMVYEEIQTMISTLGVLKTGKKFFLKAHLPDAFFLLSYVTNYVYGNSRVQLRTSLSLSLKNLKKFFLS